MIPMHRHMCGSQCVYASHNPRNEATSNLQLSWSPHLCSLQDFMPAGGRLVLPCLYDYPHTSADFLQNGGPWAALKAGDAARAAAATALGCTANFQVRADSCSSSPDFAAALFWLVSSDVASSDEHLSKYIRSFVAGTWADDGSVSAVGLGVGLRAVQH